MTGERTKRESIKTLDGILRGEARLQSALHRGERSFSIGGVGGLAILLTAVYGLGMGSFSLFREQGPSWQQLFASTLKVPALFALTLVVTFPSLYVFSAIFGARLKLSSILRLLISTLSVNLCVLASLGPIVAFFSVSSTSYPFMVLLNVVMFTVAGLFGLAFLRSNLVELGELQDQEEEQDAVEVIPDEEADAAPGAPAFFRTQRRRKGQPSSARLVRGLMAAWMVVFGLVGAQMGWVLRPLIGDPDRPFTWFRERESNFFEALVGTLRDLIG